VVRIDPESRGSKCPPSAVDPQNNVHRAPGNDTGPIRSRSSDPNRGIKRRRRPSTASRVETRRVID